MDGDLFGVGPPVSNNTGNAAVGSYSDEPSLLDFASPPPSQETTDSLDSLPPPQSEPPNQHTTENLLDFAPQPTPSQEPLVDLFGDSQLSPNPTENATPQQPSQAAQPLDLFGSPMPSATTPTPSQTTTTVDLFAPIVSPAPMAATAPVVSTPVVDEDPFAAFLQPQVTPTPQQQQQQPAKSDPFSSLSGNLSIPAPPKASTKPSTNTIKPADTTDNLQTNPVSIENLQTTTTTSPPQESETTQIAKLVVQIDEEEKKDQDSMMMTVDLMDEEKVVEIVDENSKNTIASENSANKEEVVEDEDEPHELDLVENAAQETTSVSTTLPDKAPIVSSTTAAVQQPPQQQSQTQRQDSAPKLLPTLTKVSKAAEKRTPVVANRFAGFKSMAESMAQKGAERVAKVKDQIQKDEAENGTKQRFAGFKNMAETMAAKGAERVAKVKDQIQKEDANGQNGNGKRLSGFKSMAGNIARASVQSSKQFNAENLSKFATKFETKIESMTRSNHGPKKAVAVQSALSSSGSTTTNQKPKQAQASSPATVAKSPQSESSTPPSTTSTSSPITTEKTTLASEKQASEASTDSLVEPAKKSAESIISPQKDDTAKEVQKSSIPPAKDSSVETNANESKGSDSTLEKNEVKSKNHVDASKSISSQPPGSEPTPKIENAVPHKPLEASKQPPTPQIAPETNESSPSKEILNQIEILKKELEAAQSRIKELQTREKEGKDAEDSLMVELQANLQKEMTRRAEAEDKARVAIKKSKRMEEEYTTFKTQSITNLNDVTTSMESLKKEKDAMEKELVEIREERDEQARKEMALTTRLNDAKKKEAVKANAAEHYGDQVDQLQLAVNEYVSQVETLTAERDQLKAELGEWKEYAEKRTGQLEMALNDEKKLNDERKKKMKGFVEAKTEEVRAAKADYISLQTELDQTSHSLTELNQRYKQLHAQWVQSQTRNRELQRDAMKMKKDSEKMHKVGGSLEARLSRSAQQSEDHKNKRIEARNELMSVLGQLEAERTVNSRLQESIKMTFTPKALSQQQTIQEALDDFDAALQKLSIRIGRPLPPTFSTVDPSAFGDADGANETDTDDATDGSKTSTTLSEINSNKALQKLENETQRVSQKIVKFSASVEQMHSLLDGGGTKSCVDIFSQILKSGNTPAIAASSGQRYGQLSRNVP